MAKGSRRTTLRNGRVTGGLMAIGDNMDDSYAQRHPMLRVKNAMIKRGAAGKGQPAQSGNGGKGTTSEMGMIKTATPFKQETQGKATDRGASITRGGVTTKAKFIGEDV